MFVLMLPASRTSLATRLSLTSLLTDATQGSSVLCTCLTWYWTHYPDFFQRGRGYSHTPSLLFCLSHLTLTFVIWNPELRADIIYYDAEYLDFPIPRLVFGIRMLNSGKVVECSIGVVADEVPSLETKMFHYPLSNVYEGGKVCTGNNVLPRYKKLTALKHFPRYLLGLPDNDDYYDRKKNRLDLNHKELLEHLKDKDPKYYYSDILVPNEKTLADFIHGR